MNKQEWARCVARTANVLITVSIFLVMIWWGASLILFSVCCVLYSMAWWLQEDVPGAAATPDEAGLLSPFRLHR